MYGLGTKKDYGDKHCHTCKDVFQATSSSHKYCSIDCKKAGTIKKAKKELSRYIPKNEKGKPVYPINKIKKLVRARKYKITDERVVNYDSPTGKAYIGMSKHPLQQASGYHGYLGVLLQTDNRTLVQCHVCGKWLQYITSRHLEKHGMTTDEYRKEFGLNKKKALLSDDLSYKHEEAGRKTIALWNKNNPMTVAMHLDIQRKKSVAKTKGTKQNYKANIELQNKNGTCEKQLEYRLVNYLKTYKSLPSRSTKGEGGKLCKAIFRRYGSLNNGFKHFGLPSRHRAGTRVELVSGDKMMSFNYNKGYSRDGVYKWIVSNSKNKYI